MSYIFCFATLTLLTIWLIPVHSLPPVMVFSRQLPGRVIVMLHGLNVQACVRECDVRPSCMSVNYRRAYTECQLNDDSDDNVALVKTPGSVYVKKTAPATPCGAVTCTSGQVCLTESSDCDVKECPRPQVQNSTVLGNMVDIGSRVYLSCSPGHVMQIDNDLQHANIVSWQCQPGGNWSGPNFTCHTDDCRDDLVNGDQPIDDSAITASSHWDNLEAYHPRHSRITTPPTGDGAWVAGRTDLVPYIQARFPTLKMITGVVTGGRDGANQYVTSYRMTYSQDCTTFYDVTDTNGDIEVFPGNNGDHQLVTNHLSLPVEALCVRLHMVTFQTNTAMRFDIIGCDHTV